MKNCLFPSFTKIIYVIILYGSEPSRAVSSEVCHYKIYHDNINYNKKQLNVNVLILNTEKGKKGSKKYLYKFLPLEK